MIYFSDLDRTIICSKKLIAKDDNAICIEYKDGKEISYITNDILNKIKELNTSKIFIPTTTRSIEQFNRINFKDFGINFKYSITSNGAHIFKNGELLDSWEKEIESLKKDATDMNKIISDYNNLFSKKISKYIKNFKIVENNFFYIVLNKADDPIDFLSDFIKYLEDNGWVYFKNCSKAYFLPKGMTKENAIKFIVENEFESKDFYALGDSNMDVGMLSVAKKAYIPKHGDISSTFKHNDLYVTNAEGLEAINEMLEKILLEVR